MANVPYKLYQFNTNNNPSFQYLPGTNTPSGATEVNETFAKDFITKNGLNQWDISGKALNAQPGDAAWQAFLGQRNEKINYNDIYNSSLLGKTTDSGVAALSQPFQGFTGAPSDFVTPQQQTQATQNAQATAQGANPLVTPPSAQQLQEGQQNQGSTPGVIQGGNTPNQTNTVAFPTVALQPGATGMDVKKLQDYLVSKGLMTPEQVAMGTGIYGPQTTMAVLKLQQMLGVDNSSGPGYFGPKTLTALQANGEQIGNSNGSGNGASGASGSTPGNVTSPTAPQQSPIDFIAQYKQALTDLGIPNIKTEFDKTVKAFADLQNELNEKTQDITDNPWMTQGVKDRNVQQIKNRYQTRLDTLTHQQQLYDSLYKEGIAQAQFMTTGEQKFQADMLDNAQKALEAQNKLAQLDTQVVEVNGHKLLINSKTGTTIADLGKAASSLQASPTVKSGGLIVSESNIAANQAILDSGRGSDGYVNSKTYLDMLADWKKNLGLEQDFFSKYPPKNYLNPSDTSIPTYIRDKLKASDNTPLFGN